MQTDASSHRQFFGDAERAFALPPELIAELERKLVVGIGGLSRRFFAGDFAHRELLEVIRLGLIGGGTEPEEAAALVEAYAAHRPVMEAYGLALPIMETTMFGAVLSPTDGRESAEAAGSPGYHPDAEEDP